METGRLPGAIAAANLQFSEKPGDSPGTGERTRKNEYHQTRDHNAPCHQRTTLMLSKRKVMTFGR